MFLSVIGTSIINIMFNMLFNIRYNPDDKELVDIMSMNNQVTSSFTFNDPTAWMKWLRHVYPTQNYLLVKDAIAKRDKYLSKYLKEHFQTYKEGVKRDFTDYLIELSRHNKHSSIANESDLEMILTDMIFAGTESTMTALQWMVVYLIHWPEYQDRLLNDILKNTETGRYPCLKDKPKLHFVQAFTQEVLRFSSFVLCAHLIKQWQMKKLILTLFPRELRCFTTSGLFINKKNISHIQKNSTQTGG